MPKISAVMALYNTPYDYLKATVESILNQTFKDFELIIIDDASTINYNDFFKQFKDERIKYIRLEKNAGPGYARNEGIRLAKGNYVAITDSDDVYLPQRFKLQTDFLDKNPDIALISGAFKYSNNGKIPTVLKQDTDIKTEMIFNSQLANPAVMFKRETFLNNNLLYPENINFAEDYELWINAIFAEIKTANLEEVLMIYTRRQGQLSKEKQEKQIEILKAIYKKIFLNLGFEATSEELDLHYEIYSEKFITTENSKQISDWFDKIIKNNKELKIFDEQKLLEKKDQVINKYNKIKARLFKIKIGQKNLCINKNLKIYLEQRS